MASIEDLTLRQLKELQGFFSFDSKNYPSPKGSIYSDFVGKYVICRSYNEGVNFGKVEKLDHTGVILSECRRLYYFKPLDSSKSWYEGVAKSGLSSEAKISTVGEKLICEKYSLTLCSNESVENIKNFKDNAS